MATLAKVLITGASGLLGGYLAHIAKGHEVYGTWNTNMLPGKNYLLDITDPSAVAVLFERIRPDVVIHCAAIGSVDFCERNWQISNNVNVNGAVNIATACQEYKAKMVFISTNAIFNGENPPYAETSKDYPVNRYGRLKLDAEIAVKLLLPDSLIVRPIMLYGWPLPGGRSNWATRILDALHERKDIDLVNDVNTHPTFARDCAKVIWWLVDHEQTGTFHVGSPTVATIYKWGLAIAREWGFGRSCMKCLHPVLSSTFGDLAPRPKDTTYDLTKLRETVPDDVFPETLIGGLRQMRQESLDFAGEGG